MPVIVTPIYAGLLTFVYLVLSVRVISRRRALWITLGDKGDEQLQRRTRVHGNFAEYVPLSLVLMICAELMVAPVWALHATGGCILLGRLLHAYGVGRAPESLALRTYGMVLTFAALASGAILNLSLAVLYADFAG